MSARLADDKVPHFVMGGNALFTVVSKRTGTKFTFKVTKDRTSGSNRHYVKVLNGPNNESDYVFVGTVFDGTRYVHGRKSPVGPKSPSASAANWFFHLLGTPRLTEQCDVYHAGRCCRCGRTLTVPESIESGIGPECARKGGL